MSTFTIENGVGSVTTSTDPLTFYVIKVLPDFNDTFDGDASYFSTGGDAEITAFEVSNVIIGATRMPAPFQSNLFHLEGESDLNDSG
ncbi:MAG: hypothetical protein ACI9A7_002351 [Cyclobacteriaceae bacterium]|jgi:hypothetical protein